jgi:hypothetical protein
MSTVNVSIRQARTFSNVPSSYIVSSLCTKLAGIIEASNGAYQDIIGIYNENWSSFVRRSTTDFERDEWVKRNFKPAAKDFEAVLKNLDDRFDAKHQTYKNCKSVLAKCAFAMIALENDDGSLRSLAELKKLLKEAGIGESLHTMLSRQCKALAPVDNDTGESVYTVQEYSEAGMLMDDPTVARRAFEALAHVMGLQTASASIQAMLVQAAGGKVTIDGDAE